MQDFFGTSSNNNQRRSTRTNSNTTLDNRAPSILTPEEIESQALSYYKSARIYENQYYDTEKSDYAKIAIEKFGNYYNLQPTGSYAGLALLRIAELSYHIGDKNRAIFELRRIKSRYDLSSKYKDEIALIENLINQWEQEF